MAAIGSSRNERAITFTERLVRENSAKRVVATAVRADGTTRPALRRFLAVSRSNRQDHSTRFGGTAELAYGTRSRSKRPRGRGEKGHETTPFISFVFGCWSAICGAGTSALKKKKNVRARRDDVFLCAAGVSSTRTECRRHNRQTTVSIRTVVRRSLYGVPDGSE